MSHRKKLRHAMRASLGVVRPSSLLRHPNQPLIGKNPMEVPALAISNNRSGRESCTGSPGCRGNLSNIQRLSVQAWWGYFIC
jgi:hypothetical protein